MEKAIFAAGCFWGVESVFRSTEGVLATSVGYIGGDIDDPTYQLVCSGSTGHAEAVQVEFDPSVVTYDDLLEIFWANHDPTTLNRQGPDHGTQYRSAIFTLGEEQKSSANRSIERQLETARFKRPITTIIQPATPFFLAEDYHQHYLEKRGKAFCHL